MNECLNHFFAARNTRASAVIGELALVIPRSKTDKFSSVGLSACCCSSVEFAAVGRV